MALLATLTPDVELRLSHLDPLTLYVPVPAFCILLAAYKTIAPHFSSPRQRAYILSAICSSCMTLASLPFAYAYFTGGIQGLWTAGQEGWMRTSSTVFVSAFGTYLFTDLLVGWFEYRNYVGLLTGWFHHIVYMGLMVHLATSRQSPIFLGAALMELPTFDLAISNLFPSVRCDERFLGLMVLTRIGYNIVLVVDTMRPSSRAIMDNSWVPTVMLASALSLHCLWMHGGITGYLARRSKARAAAAAAKQQEVIHEKPERLHLPMPESGLATPDESPLVTPHTPGQPSLMIPQNLFPNISMPTMANIPIPNIPTLSGMAAALPQAKANLEQLSFGLKGAKEAAFNRWQEQRELWQEQRERLSAAGLRLRRRDTDPAGAPMTADELME